jgi:hypothetical protein
MNPITEIRNLINNEIVYINTLPLDAKDNIVVLYEYDSLVPEMVLGKNKPEISYPLIQIKVRDKSFNLAYSRLRAIINDLIGQTNLIYTDFTILSIMQQRDIISLGQDERNRTELVLNIKLTLNWL